MLAQHGMATNLMAPAGRVPSLRVINPAAPALAEDVYAGCCEDGSWWFWWSWAERIAAATELDARRNVSRTSWPRRTAAEDWPTATGRRPTGRRPGPSTPDRARPPAR